MRHMHRLRHLALLIVMVVSLIVVASPAYAGDATVTDCTNFTGLGTISDAVATANSGGGIITFTCSGTIIFANQLTITANVTINANGNTVIFDEVGNDNRLFVVNPGASLTLNGFTLQNGNAIIGGAIVNDGTLTITDSVLSGNSASTGGAIYNVGTVTITNSTLSGNSASSGGAIINFGTVTITDSTLSGNSAAAAGGAIANQSGGTVTITDSTLSGNSATNGGAIRNNGTASSQNSQYTNNTCTNNAITNNGGNVANTALGCPGEALTVDPLSCVGNDMIVNITGGDANFNITGTGTNLPMNNVIIAPHAVTGPGSWTGVTVTELDGDAQFVNLGNITCPPPPPPITINTCDFATLQAAVTSANVAGGTINFACSGTITFTSTLTITNAVTINENGNNVIFDGAGARRHFIVNTGASLTLDGFTLQNGNAGNGGAISNSGTLTITTSTLSGNSATNQGGAIYNNGGTVTINTSTLSNNFASSLGGAILNIGGTVIINTSTLSGNSASSFGGAIFNTATMTITNSTLLNNSAPVGGAIRNDGGTVNSQNTYYEGNATNNTCSGVITNNGGNTRVNSAGCPGNADLVTSAVCVGADLHVTITDGDGTFDITATAGGTVPVLNVGVNTHILTGGTGDWTNVQVYEDGGDTQIDSLGDFDCLTPLTANVTCVGDDLVVNIIGGDGPFNILGTGAGLPSNGVGVNTYTFNGPASWTGVSVAETTGDSEALPIADFTCQIPLFASVGCAPNGDLEVNILTGDANFNITGTGAGLPMNNVGIGTHTLNDDDLGVNSWSVTVTEIGFNGQSVGGTANCNVPLVASAVCNGTNLEVTTTSGDVSFNITDGATNYGLGVGLTTTIITGPVTTANLTVTETGGDAQFINLGVFNCSNTLTANAVCDANGGLAVTITSGDPNFNITGTGTGLPNNNVGTGTYTLNDDVLGVNSWTGVTVTEIGGNNEVLLLGDFNCNVPLVASAICNGTMLEVTATSGDVSFTISDDSLTHYTGVGLGMQTITGPLTSTNLTVTETGGDVESINLGIFNCSNPLSGAITCDVNGDLNITLTGDFPITVSGTGLGLPQTFNVANTIITGNAMGPNTWSNVFFTETTGNTETTSGLPIDITCNKPLAVNAICVGPDLHVTVNAADVSVDLTDGATNIQTGVGFGTLIIPGPINVTALTATETGGDAQSSLIGTGVFNCFASSTLTATATCNGNALEIIITNGNAPFSISVTDSVGVMNLGSLPLGVYPFLGPDTFSNISIVEETGEPETLNLPAIACPSLVPVVPVTVVLPPDPNALGCELTSTVNMPNATDNTYCRVLMRDGAVVGYAGAIPQSLIDLGVIFAVDVYQLRGGQAVNDFTDYQQICLNGAGRLFYMDSRQSPRSLIELATETFSGMTCGWIPAPGTLILTSR